MIRGQNDYGFTKPIACNTVIDKEISNIIETVSKSNKVKNINLN